VALLGDEGREGEAPPVEEVAVAEEEEEEVVVVDPEK
jgi:hypothetical protein